MTDRERAFERLAFAADTAEAAAVFLRSGRAHTPEAVEAVRGQLDRAIGACSEARKLLHDALVLEHRIAALRAASAERDRESN